MPRRVATLVLLLCLPLPTAVAAHAAPAGIEGPDPAGAYTLSFDLHRDAAGPVLLALDVLRVDADGSQSGARDLGLVELPAGQTRYATTFLPSEGAGTYTVALVVDGARGPEHTFVVSDANAATTVSFSVPDEPTTLALANDTVNADGKVKSPGEALVTRAVVADANGLIDIDALLWTVETNGTAVAEGSLQPPANATSWSFEHRFDRSPFEAGNHTLRLRAVKAASVVASVSRTFVIRDVAPTFVSGTLAAVVPDENVTQTTTVTLGDKNGIPANSFEPRVYRGSARVESAGFEAAMGPPTRLADENATAQISYRLALRVPERAAAGAYRVSLYADGALVGSMPFEVRALPTLAGVNASTESGRLALRINGTGEGILVARLTDGAGSTTTVSAPHANGTILIDAPRKGVPLRWNVSLHTRAGGPLVAAREGNWSAPLDGAALALIPLHVGARLPASWRLESAWPLDDANVTFSVARWDGQAEPRITVAHEAGRVRVSAPSDIPAGRYTARAVMSWANGSASETSWSFEAGPWVELTLGAPVVDGANATVTVRNSGGIGVAKLVVETQPRASVSLLRGGTVHTPVDSGGRSVFSAALDVGEEATLRLELPPGARRSGAHDVAVRVLARVEIG